VDGSYDIKLGEATYYFEIQVLTDRQTSLSDQESLPLTVTTVVDKSKGTYVLEKFCGPNNRSVVLWIPGKNDVFMHPHVAKIMLKQGFDVWVYNYTNSLRATSADSHLFASHVPSGSFDGLLGEMQEVVESLQAKYKTVVAYAHSTGATILTNYLLENPQHNHEVFQAIYLNSPFLEWGRFGLAEEALLRGTPFMVDVMGLSPDMVLRAGGRFNAWHARIHTQHEYDTASYGSDRTIHTTLGYAAASQRVFDKLEAVHAKKKGLVTTVPVCMITVKNDDLLDARETIERTAWIGPPARHTNLSLDTGSHDVFLSPTVLEVQKALDHLGQFLSSTVGPGGVLEPPSVVE
jgi:alpha-beta hydrolase superfamily lysophospholipase